MPAWVATVLGAIAIAFFAYDLVRRSSPRATDEAGGTEAGAGAAVPGSGVGVAATGIGAAGAVGTGAAGGAAALRASAASMADVLRSSAASDPLAMLRGEEDLSKPVVLVHRSDVTEELQADGWLGNTYSSVTARGCAVPFSLALDRMGSDDVVFVPGTGGEPSRIIVVAPRPRVDPELLVVAPESLEFAERRSGMPYARSWQGIDGRERLVRLLRPRILESAADAAVRAEAEQAGRTLIERRVQAALRDGVRAGRDVVVDVRWAD